jgi:DNA-binding CsgD family transcriptional regulator
LRDVQFKLKNLIEIDSKNPDISVNSDEIKRQFFDRLLMAHPNLSSKDLEMCSHIRLNLSSKEIAPLLKISVRSIEIKRYRLRKKMNLTHEEDLVEYLLSF